MRRGPLKSAAVSAQKDLQGSETEMRELPGGVEEKRFPQQELIDLISRQITDFFIYLPRLIIDSLPPSYSNQKVLFTTIYISQFDPLVGFRALTIRKGVSSLSKGEN